jgi:hypothetical protein
MPETRRRSASTTDRGTTGPVIDVEEAAGFQDRWESIQIAFVEDPRNALQDADGLVKEVIDRLRDTFADERKSLESAWGDENEVSTEDMRVALQRYRSFFHRLLSTA